MMREGSALVFEGAAESMPGELWTLYHSTGERRTLLLDSTFEASVFARYFGVPLSFAVPAVVDPRRALDYTNIEESMHIPVAGLFSSNKVDGQRYASTLVTGPKFDALNENDKNVSFGGG